MIDMHFSGTAADILHDLQTIFPALLAGTPLPPMQEQPKENRDPAPLEPKPKPKPRKKEDEPAAPLASAAETSSSEAETANAAVVDLDDLRAALKKVGATDGLGHDKVFEILGKYDAKTASTVPVEKRAAVMADLNAALASVKS